MTVAPDVNKSFSPNRFGRLGDHIKMVAVISSMGALVVIGLSILFGSWYQIDQGERGVVLRNGRMIDIAGPGLHFKIPIMDTVKEISVRTESFRYENVLAYSKDQQTAGLQLSIAVSVDPGEVGRIYEDYGTLEGFMNRIVHPRAYEEAKTVFGKFNAMTAIQERARLNAEIMEAIQKSVIGTGGNVESVQLENIDFSDAYEHSIEARMQAEVEVARLRQQNEQEKVKADMVRVQASAQADARRAAAQAEAEAIRLRGEAEASAINARGQALRNNPDLVGLVKAERWNGVLPSTMIPGGTIPFINVGKE